MSRRHPHHKPAHCLVCGKAGGAIELEPVALLRPPLLAMLKAEHPDCGADSYLCTSDLNRYRARYVAALLSEEKGELTAIERDVVRGLAGDELLSQDTNLEFDRRLSFGERLADRIATFGGSWTFILAFAGFLGVWIAVNSWLLLHRPFDPYPFILLNLILSCLAALQAPVIMMSQNRQEAKDRLRAEYDYRVNLKAELEIRLLSERIDRLLTHQWQRLLEIQQVQVELIEQLDARNPRPPAANPQPPQP